MKTMRTAPRFSRYNQPTKCRGCGKLTTQNVKGVVGLDLCAGCQDAAGLENEHNDRGHDSPVDGCPLCAEVAS